jgi:uncharacterized YigZ family protein
LTNLLPLARAEAAASLIAGIRKQHPAARHHCSALICGNDAQIQRSNDDGEPSSTAGQPMLQVLRGRQVTNVLAVVTRYFGGILLGTGGLIRAYSAAVVAGLENARLACYQPRQTVEITLSAQQLGRGEHVLRHWAAEHHVKPDVSYGQLTTFRVCVEPTATQSLVELAAARTWPVQLGEIQSVAVLDDRK